MSIIVQKGALSSSMLQRKSLIDREQFPHISTIKFMHPKLKNFLGVLLAVLLLSCTWCIYKGALLLGSAHEAAQASKALAEEAKSLISKANPKIISTLDSLESSSKAVEKVSNAQANLFLDKKTATNFGVLVRKADNVVRIIDHVESIVEQVDYSTISKTNNAIDAGTKTLQSADTLLLTADKNLDKLSDIAAKDLDGLHNLLADPNIKTLLANITETSQQAKQIAQNLGVSSEEIKQNLPELITELKSILHNIDQGTLETSTFIAGLNKPLTKKQKALRFLIQIAAIAAPTLRR